MKLIGSRCNRALAPLLFIGIVFFVQPAFAAISVSLSNTPATVDQDQEFSVNVSFVCSGCTSDSFLRGVFYPSGTSYFGFTQDNTGNWINAPGGNCTQYYKIAASDLQQGSWSGTLKFKPDSASALYQGPGDYLFKLGRYTNSCGTPTWSSETTVAVTGPTPTPIPTPTNTQTPTPQPTCTPTPTRTPTPTKTPTPTPTVTPTSTLEPTASDSAVLGVTNSHKFATKSADPAPKSSSKKMIIGILCIGVGCGMLAIASILKR